MRKFLIAIALLMAGPVSAAEIMVMDAYARASRPGAPTGAVFMMLHNMGDTDDRLIGAQSPIAKVAQIHTSIDKDGVVSMLHLEDGIAVAAACELMGCAGGDHVMLLGVTEELVDGEKIPVTLTFEKAGDVTVDVIVDNKRGQGGGHTHNLSLIHI